MRAPRRSRLPAVLVLLTCSVALVLGTAAPVLAADDLAAARLELDDLPSGFRRVSEQELAESIHVASEDLAPGFEEGLAKARFRNYAVFASPDGGEVVLSFLVGPLTELEQAAVDRDFASGASRVRELLDNLTSGVPFEEPRELDTRRIGDASLGFQVRAFGDSRGAEPDLENFLGATGPIATTELVVARRGSYALFVAVLYLGREDPSVDAIALAETLDAKVSSALGIGGYRASDTLVPELTTHIPTPLDVSTDPTVVFANLLIAAIATVLFTIALRILNATLAGHEHDLQRAIPPARWFGTAQARADRVLSARLGRRADAIRLLGILLFYGVVFSFLEPGWNPLTITGLALLLYMTIAFGAAGIMDDLVQWRAARRQGLDARLAVKPSLALLAISSTAATRIFGIVPGIMIGTPEAFPVEKEHLGEAQQRRLLRLGGMTLVVLGGGSWILSIGTDLAQRAGLPDLVETAVAGLQAFLLVVFAVTVQNLFMQMLALPGSIGGELQRRNRWVWLAAFAGTTFLFLHTLLNPRGDVAAALGETNVLFFLGTVVAFVLVSLGIWLGFRRAERRGLLTAAPAVRPAALAPYEAPVLPASPVALTPYATPVLPASPAAVGAGGPLPPGPGTGIAAGGRPSTSGWLPPPPSPLPPWPPPRGRVGLAAMFVLTVVGLVLVVFAAIAVVLTLSSGPDGGSEPAATVSAPPSGEAQAGVGDEPGGTQGAGGGTIEGKPVEVVEQGFSRFELDYGGAALSWAAVLHNPNPNLVVTLDVLVTLSGTAGGTEDRGVLILMPGETAALANTLHGVAPARGMRIEIGNQTAYTRSEWKQEGRPLGSFTAADVDVTSSEFRGLTVTADMTSAYARGIRKPYAVAVLRDEDGRIVGGAFVFPKQIALSGPTPIEISSYSDVPGATRADVFVTLSWLSF